MPSGKPIAKPLKVPQEARYLKHRWDAQRNEWIDVVIVATELRAGRIRWYRVAWADQDGPHVFWTVRSDLKPHRGRSWEWQESEKTPP